MVDGITITQRWDGGVPARIRAAAAQGVNAALEQLLGAAKELSPVDSGDNRRSGSVQEADSRDMTGWVIFNMPYSAAIHEAVDANFNVSKNPLAQAKYLETPLIRDRDQLVQIVQSFIRRAM